MDTEFATGCFLFNFLFFLQHGKITINLCKCQDVLCQVWQPGCEYWVAAGLFYFIFAYPFQAFFPVVVVFVRKKEKNNSCACLMGCHQG